MGPELAFLVAFGSTLLFTPLAIRLARRTSFYDHPIGYKGHGSPTPYLGGIAVIGGLLVGSALFGSGSSAFVPIAIGTVVLLGVGTIDDRYALGPLTRLAIEVAAASVLFAGGIGWDLFASDVLNLGLTVVFVSHDLRAVSAVSDRIACLNLTLHYHDVPEHLPSDLVYRMFACDLEAFGLQGAHSCAGNVCETHTHASSDKHVVPSAARDLGVENHSEARDPSLRSG